MATDPKQMPAWAAEKYYRMGFEDCRAQSLHVVDEHDGYSSRIGMLEPMLPELQRRHEWKIKEKREEIKWMKNAIPNCYPYNDERKDETTRKRVLSLLEAQLEDLLRGWRQG